MEEWEPCGLPSDDGDSPEKGILPKSIARSLRLGWPRRIMEPSLPLLLTIFPEKIINVILV